VSAASLPRVLCSSVIRSVHQGESHGGVYLVDLGAGAAERVIDWSDDSIDWEGRGGDRGLRGIAFHDGLVYLAASDEVFVYDREFRQQGSFRNRYLKHCHEINVAGDRLYLASTGYDSVLEFDLVRQAFSRAWMLRYGPSAKFVKRLGRRPRPRWKAYDPSLGDGPEPADTTHINNVWPHEGSVYACGTRLGTLWKIPLDDPASRPSAFATVPFGTHNARPFRDGVLFNHTASDRIVYADRSGTTRSSLALPAYAPETLEHADLPGDLARPNFGRGLTVVGDSTVIGGSSPATITAFDLDTGERLASVTITMDVRNAVHGLEVWPFDSPGG
jgi:hypothetical protein